MSENVRNKGRQKFLPLEKPQSIPDLSTPNREAYINDLCNGFVSPSTTNKEYYRTVVEELWPIGHGIPGPIVSQDELRNAINREREKKWTKSEPYKPYIDVFRRIRELQGEEGLIGIGREGNRYQLVNLTLGPKREPRTKLTVVDWEIVLSKYGFSCAVCKKKEPEVRFDQDHKVPRVRGGGSSLDNWQPLCGECNNFKSTSCRGCELDCYKCPWAFPETHSFLVVNQENHDKVVALAVQLGESPNNTLNRIIADYIKLDEL
jgi:5-methylcytosine-specific restriction endonuclease McrA